MTTCLYCGEQKSPQEFNREHVIPEAFGTFQHNFVLRNVVCRSCNSYFSRDLELSLTRDSAEALVRFHPSVASPSKMKRFGRTLMTCRLTEGPAAGATVELRPVDGELKAFLVDQIGCATSENGPFEWYAIHALPSREVLHAKGLVPGSAYFRFNLEGPDRLDAAQEALRDRGYKTDATQFMAELAPDADGRLPTQVSGSIDRILTRCIAKIAVNYFAYQYEGLARLDQFAEVRHFVRYGDWPKKSPVSISHDSVFGGVDDNQQLLSHVITLSGEGPDIIAQVSLYSAFLYRIRLGPNLMVAPDFLDIGHLFNPASGRITQLRQARTATEKRWKPPMADQPENDPTI